MIFQQFRHEEGGCLSYLLGCTRTHVCAVVDPHLMIDTYVEYAARHQMSISHIFETHSQADHLSGAKLLGERTGAAVHFHDSVKPAFPVHPVHDGETLMVGNIRLQVLHTPGHTSDSISILVSDTTRSDDPWLVLTGDTLFVGDTGRPDLNGSAEQLYESIWNKLLPLNDTVEIYPSHFAGSVCGKAMSPKPSSTIGFERRFNPALQCASKEAFVDFVSSDLPIQPPRFVKVRQFNLGFLREPPIEKTYDAESLEIEVDELKRRFDRGEKPFLLDVREQFEYHIANLSGTLIPLRELGHRYAELDSEAEIIIYCHHGNRSRAAVQFLYEKGFRNVKNMAGGIDAWSQQIDPTIPRY